MEYLLLNVAYYLNPWFHYAHDIGNHFDLVASSKAVIRKLEPNIDVQVQALNDIKYFRDQLLSFGDPSTIATRDTMTPRYVCHIIQVNNRCSMEEML